MSKYDHEARLKRLDELETARKLWTQSEWVLNFLRTQTGAPTPEPTDEEVLQWFQQHQQHRLYPQ